MKAKIPVCSNWGFRPFPRAAELLDFLYSVRHELDTTSGKSMEKQEREDILLNLIAKSYPRM